MLSHQQPADVAEEEAPGAVVRIAVGVGELEKAFRVKMFLILGFSLKTNLVVGPVVPAPGEEVVLEAEDVEERQDDAKAGAGLVGSVRPQAVGSWWERSYF